MQRVAVTFPIHLWKWSALSILSICTAKAFRIFSVIFSAAFRSFSNLWHWKETGVWAKIRSFLELQATRETLKKSLAADQRSFYRLLEQDSAMESSFSRCAFCSQSIWLDFPKTLCIYKSASRMIFVMLLAEFCYTVLLDCTRRNLLTVCLSSTDRSRCGSSCRQHRSRRSCHP